MASQDLQSLYKIRDILKREEYIKTYNKNVNQNHINSTNNAISSLVTRKNMAQRGYENAKAKLRDGTFLTRGFIVPFVMYLVAIVALIILIGARAEENSLYYYMYLAVTVCYFSIILISSVTFATEPTKSGGKTVPKDVPHSGKSMLVGFLSAVGGFILALFFAGKIGVFVGFFNKVIAFVAFLFWPLTNFLCLGSDKTLGLIIFFVILLVDIYWAVCINKDWDKTLNSSSEVKKAKEELDRCTNEYNKAYTAEFARQKPDFQKQLKPDTYTKEKNAMVSVLPLQFQNMDMVNKLIWCIEQKYAYDIVSARNWYLQQEQNAAMMQKMQQVANQLNEANEIRRRAAEEAAAASKATIAAIEKQTKEINKQMGKLNETAKENAAANKKTSELADKIHMEIKY